MQTYDAIVIGAGHHGLVAGAYLARAGWEVAVLERDARPGGAVRSDELTRPGLVHDTFATNMNLFRGSPVARELGPDLDRHGLAYASSARPFANVFPDGSALRVHQDREATLAGLDAHDRRDGGGWRALDALYERIAPALFGVYAARLSAPALARAALAAAPGLRPGDASAIARLALSSTRDLSEEHLATREARTLLPSWGMHLDFGPDVAGGALFPFLEAFTDMRVGIAIVRGGASRLPEALAAGRAESCGPAPRSCACWSRTAARAASSWPAASGWAPAAR
jgi:phytoene dehydrogenase-like protein